MRKDYLTAIIICIEQGAERGYKYHDVRNIPARIATFMRFASGKPGHKWVNFYYKTDHKSEKGRNFAFRRYFNNP